MWGKLLTTLAGAAKNSSDRRRSDLERQIINPPDLDNATPADSATWDRAFNLLRQAGQHQRDRSQQLNSQLKVNPQMNWNNLGGF